MGTPLVTVLLPTRNGADFITEAIGSVLGQSLVDFELLVIDDGSIDETPAAIGDFAQRDRRIRTIRNAETLGIQKSLNRGLREAKSEYIARIDDDDEWIEPQKLEKQVRFLEAHPDHALVGTGALLTDEKGNEIGRKMMPETDEAIRARLLGRNCFFHASVVLRKDAILQQGGYDESPATLYVEDYDLWLKLGLRYKFGNLPIIAVKHTVRPAGLSQKHKLTQLRNNMRLFRKYRGNYPNPTLSFLRHLGRLAIYGHLHFPMRPHFLRPFAK